LEAASVGAAGAMGCALGKLLTQPANAKSTITSPQTRANGLTTRIPYFLAPTRGPRRLHRAFSSTNLLYSNGSDKQ
jgi:hypothetical protein